MIQNEPKNMKIVKADIRTMTKNSVQFEDGTEIPCDALILATGE
jgi:hypothetical protein